MPKVPIRPIAIALLRTAVNIAPAQAADWAQAMFAELHHIEGDWTAFAWAVGSTGVLAKHAIFDLFVPNHALSEANLFAKEKPMRKSTAIAAAACIAASLLFFAAPTFRQAFQLSVIQWRGLMHATFHTGSVALDARFDDAAIVKQAEANDDAEGIAYAAVHAYGPNAAKLADRAVSMDPKLTWIYAIMPAGRSQIETNDWISQLGQFDPQNAIPHLMQANAALENDTLSKYLADPVWLDAMAAAFTSAKLDTYADRVRDLDRKVGLRYKIDDLKAAPYEYFRIAGAYPGMGIPNAYIKILLDSGDASAARGDYPGAEKQYRLAAHFGEMVEASRATPIEAFRNSFFAAILLQKPYERLAALYEKQGNQTQAQHFADLATNASRVSQNDGAKLRRAINGSRAEGRNAKILGVAGIALFVCAAIIPLCAIFTITRSRSMRLSELKTTLLTRVLARGSIVGLLVSTIALYSSYRPYADIVRNYLRDGNPDPLLTLGAFLSDLDYGQTPPRHETLYSLWSFPMYFWAGVIVLCAAALLLVAAKFLWQKRSAIPA